MQLNGLYSRARSYQTKIFYLCIQILSGYMYLAVDFFYQMYELVLMCMYSFG